MKDSRHDAGDGHVEPLLDLYRTGELEAAERARVAAHLAKCPACAAALGENEAFAATVERGYAAGRVIAAGREPDWARQRQAILTRTSARPARGGAGRLLRYAPQAAVAALALIAVGVLYEEGIRGPSEAERALRPSKPAASRSSEPPAPPDRDRGNAAIEARSETVPEEEGAGFRDEAAPSTLGAAGEGRVRGAGVGGAYADKEHAARLAAAEEKPAAKAAPEAPVGERVQAAAPPPAGARQAAKDRREVDELRGDLAEPPAAGKEAAARNEVAAQKQARPAAPPADREAEALADANKNLRDQAPTDAVRRYELQARAALASGDTLAARRSLSLWRDSLAAGADLESSRLAIAQALADSLVALLAARP